MSAAHAHRRAWAIALLAVCFDGLLTPLALAQRPPIFGTGIGIVELQATVKNERGQLVTTLDRAAFTVYEDGKPQAITAFSRDDVAVSVGIVLDHSRSMRATRRGVEAAALALVRASNPQDEVFVLNFADKASLDVPFTSEVAALETGIGRDDCIGGSAIRDAILAGVSHLTAHAARERKVLLVVTDGNDNASVASAEQVREEAKRTGIAIYAIDLSSEADPAKADRARHALEELAEETGGVLYCARTGEEALEIARDLARQIRSQYTIRYSPEKQALDGSYRKIRLRAKGPGRLVVRTRAGYRAAPALRGEPLEKETGT